MELLPAAVSTDLRPVTCEMLQDSVFTITAPLMLHRMKVKVLLYNQKISHQPHMYNVRSFFQLRLKRATSFSAHCAKVQVKETDARFTHKQ